MKDRNIIYRHKNISNYCTKWRTIYRIILIFHPSTSPDMNLIEKYWRRMKQQLHRRCRQFIIEAKMEQIVREEWTRISQD